MDDARQSPDWQQCLARAQLLVERDRYTDAIEWCQRGLQSEPNSDYLHALLALCWMNAEGCQDQAVQAARRSVALQPETAYNHAMLSLALSHKAKEGQDTWLREALGEARAALELDANSVMALSAQTQALIRLQRWREAEESARAALAIDPENPRLGAQLGFILHRLGKHEDHEHLALYHLAEHPEDDAAHCNAGLNALRKGDHKKANAHFLEALRLDPTSEAARIGLAESFRARSWFYRSLLQFSGFIDRITGGRQTAFFIGGYIAYRVLHGVLQTTAPILAWLLVGAWLLLVFWTTLARGLVSFVMLFDRFARQSLRPREQWEGVLVGGMVFLAIGFLVAGMWVDSGFSGVSLVLFLAATPVSAAFTNDHHLGRWLYAGVTAFCLGCALYYATGVSVHAFGINWPMVGRIGNWSIYTAVLFSFVRAFGVLYR